MHPEASFAPHAGEDWKELLVKVEEFQEGARDHHGISFSGSFKTMLDTFGQYATAVWYRESVCKGCVDLRRCCCAIDPPAGVMEWLEEAAKSSAAAQYALGCHYETGDYHGSGVYAQCVD
jgi:hypothetical protein